MCNFEQYGVHKCLFLSCESFLLGNGGKSLEFISTMCNKSTKMSK